MSDTIRVEFEAGEFDIHALCASKDAINFTDDKGRSIVFTPDQFKGYFEFKIATAFPAGRIIYGIGLHPQVIANNYRSLLDQHVDWDHKMAINQPKNPNAEDKIIGSIAAVGLSHSAGGYSLASRDPLFIRGVAVFWKNAQPIKRALGEHVMGRKRATVSMDLWFEPQHSGIAVKLLAGEQPEFNPPDDFRNAGYDYVPYMDAPQELKECFDSKRVPNAVTKNYKGRQVTVMAGGFNGPIAFAGMGVVKEGAEPTAAIGRLIASAPEDTLISASRELAETIRGVGREQILVEAPQS